MMDNKNIKQICTSLFLNLQQIATIWEFDLTRQEGFKVDVSIGRREIKRTRSIIESMEEKIKNLNNSLPKI